MSDVVATRSPAWGDFADAALKTSGVLWFIPAAIGQWIFAYYIAVQYGASAFAGRWTSWNDIMANGLIAGDLAGNVAIVIHIAIAFWITIAGTLQLIPFVRNKARSFHRWNGRLYVLIAIVTSVGALYMTWARDQLGGVVSDVGISINGVLIVVFAVAAWRAAMARRFDEHQRWALRLFIAVSGVWFQRLMYGGMIVIVQGRPPGMTNDLSGPTNVAVVYGSYLIPLAVLELYLWAKRSGVAAKVATAGVVLLGASATAVGVLGATMIMWLPRIAG
ncbi:MAG: DUF2306 domain-containing protein [Terricaulis sp.]